VPGFENELRDSSVFPVDFFIQQTTENSSVVVEHHWHDCFELLYVEEGEADQWVNGQRFTMCEGDMLLLHSGDIHATLCKNHPVRILVLKFMPSVLNPQCSHAFQSPFFTGYLDYGRHSCSILPRELTLEILPLLMEIMEEYSGCAQGYEYYVKSNILRMAGILERNDFLSFETVKKNAAGFSGISKIIDYMEKNYAQDIMLSDLAREAHMSDAYFSRYFKRVTGRNYKQYLDYIRTANATFRILHDGMTVTQAAMVCGFSCAQAMTRTYTRMMGFPPSELKKNL